MNERVEAYNGLAEIFSRKMKLGAVGASPVQRLIEADAGERAALAAQFGLPAIASLAGEFTLVSAAGSGSGVIEATLNLAARLTQTCVVSLEPFDANILETATLRFIPASALREDAELAELDPESLEGPDELPYGGDVIDLGAALAEQLALALDPYPRKPGATLPPDVSSSGANPFAVLAARKILPANDPE
jgi:uncharacterized metal-binding protein YceD (DUF177 family)